MESLLFGHLAIGIINNAIDTVFTWWSVHKCLAINTVSIYFCYSLVHFPTTIMCGEVI